MAVRKGGGLLEIGRRAWALLLISLLEGAALMGVELVGAKLVAPYYGNSIYVWSAVLGTTLGGLAMGYFAGSLKAVQGRALRNLRLVLGAALLVCALLPLSSSLILDASLALGSLQGGILLSCFVILTPPLFLMGMVSPLVIQLMRRSRAESGSVTGLVYAVSTIGGIVATFLFAFQVMPFWGLKASCWCISGLLLSALVFSMSSFLFNFGDNNR